MDGSSPGNRDNQLMSSAITPAVATSITTTATTSASVGQAIGDSATVTPSTAQGSVVFTAYGPNDTTCADAAVFTSAAMPLSSGSASTAGFTPSAAGTYNWVATFTSSDTTQWTSATGACGDAGETSTVAKVTPSIVTSASDAVLPAGTVHDSATVSGLAAGATGTVSFSLYGPSSSPVCTGTPVFADSVALGAVTNGVATVTSGSFTPTAAGSYHWVASYSGDGNDAAISGSCGDPNENSVALNPANPGLSKAAVPASGSTVTRGERIDYTVTVTNTGQVDITGGTVTDTLPADVTYVPGSASDSGAYSSGQITWTVTVKAGGSVTLTYSATVDGTATNGENLVNTAAFDQLSAQTVHTVIVSSIATQATDATLPAGTVHDSATVSGLTAGATGTVSFSLYGPSSSPVCTGTPVFTDSVALGAVTNGVASATSGSFTPTAAGSYYWVASFNSGDTAKWSSVTGACGASGETSTVSPATPSISTSATSSVLPASVSDTATLGGLSAAATGSVTFTAYGPSDTAACTGTLAFTSTVPLGPVTNGAATATSGAFTPSAAGTYWWVASYAGDSNNAPALGRCGDPNESSSALTPAKPGLTKTALPASGSNVSRGQQIDYTVTVSNSGDVALNDVAVQDDVPSDVAVQTNTISNAGVYLAGTITWHVDVPGNSSVALTYSVTVNSTATDGEQLVNTAYVSEWEMSASTTHTVAVPPPPPGTAGLTITKAVSPAETANVNYGDTLTYAMTVTATGSLGQSNVTVSDYVPGHDPVRTGSGLTTYRGDAACDGTCSISYDSASHLITWNLGAMSPGQVRAVTFSVNIDTPAKAADGSIPATEILNAAAVGSTQVAILPSNEVKNVVTAVEGVKITKPPAAPSSAPSALPKTGSSAPIAPLAATAILLLGIGVGLTVAARRRQE